MLELSDFLGTLKDLIMMFLLDYFGNVLQFSLTGDVRQKGEQQEDDVDSCHQPDWLQQSAGTELPTICSRVPRLDNATEAQDCL